VASANFMGVEQDKFLRFPGQASRYATRPGSESWHLLRMEGERPSAMPTSIFHSL